MMQLTGISTSIPASIPAYISAQPDIGEELSKYLKEQYKRKCKWKDIKPWLAKTLGKSAEWKGQVATHDILGQQIFLALRLALEEGGEEEVKDFVDLMNKSMDKLHFVLVAAPELKKQITDGFQTQGKPGPDFVQMLYLMDGYEDQGLIVIIHSPTGAAAKLKLAA